MGNRDIRSVEGRGMGWCSWGKQDGHHRDFQDLAGQGTFRKESREFEGGGLGFSTGGRKDCGFGWGEIRGGVEQLF